MSNESFKLPDAIEIILSHPERRRLRDLRDRAAYVYITGCFPTHLRPEATQLLLLISKISQPFTSLDGWSGGFRVVDAAVTRLNLDAHPMVRKVREYLAQGYRICVSTANPARRPFGKIWLLKPGGPEDQRISVNINGAVLDHW